MARIAIDARKWRDYGIGTYVRNIVRALADLDHENTYFLFCHHEDVPTLKDLSENFVPVVDESPGYSIRSAKSPASAMSSAIRSRIRRASGSCPRSTSATAPTTPW